MQEVYAAPFIWSFSVEGLLIFDFSLKLLKHPYSLLPLRPHTRKVAGSTPAASTPSSGIVIGREVISFTQKRRIMVE